MRTKDYDSAQAELLAPLDEMKRFCPGSARACTTTSWVAEDELMAGQTESRFFDQVQAHTNQLLTKYAPEAPPTPSSLA
ncbi:hypothetical protein IU470_31300 [Nocardia abscessus]|uniref:Uncharacterized protein n=1 Tax=Nocardia abscessus TaxID=120957 RepID=A0ABS0CGU7_9NOCA|nr:hypothetical protein [Nocardia abscessus]MBF6229561.1 hypothetical protein [Nocardia abscessus]